MSTQAATVSTEAGIEAPAIIDVSGLPTYAFGRRDPLYWAVLLVMMIEGTGFALLMLAYFYLRDQSDLWPPTRPSVPQLISGSAVVLTLIASMIPNNLVKRAAYRGDLRDMRRWLLVTTALCFVALACRGLELYVAPFRWDSNAYGSVFWGTVTMHTFHLLTGTGENLLLLALLFKGPIEQKHLGDIEANGVYWFFVVAVWVPLFAILYLEFLVFR